MISSLPLKAVLDFKGASILPTTVILYDKDSDTLFAEVEIIQHCEKNGYRQGIRKERISLPNGHLLIEEIRKKSG